MLTDQDRMIYFWELRTRIEHALRAWDEADTSLKTGTTDDFWYHVDAFLSGSIAVLNILWPSSDKKSAHDRADELRSRLSLGPDAPDGLRVVRNGFEHFDERIDKWRASSTNHSFVDTNIGPLSSITGSDAGDIARHFDPATGELGVFGKITTVPEIITNLKAIQAVVPPRY